MVNPARALLSGVVEVDETQISYRTKDDPVCGRRWTLARTARCWS